MPRWQTASLIVKSRALKSGSPKIIATIGRIRSSTNELYERREREAQHQGDGEPLDEIAAQEEVAELLDHVCLRP